MNKQRITKHLSVSAKCLFVSILMITSLLGCVHKDLCFHHDHEVTIRVEFDWRDAPEAYPEGMVVFFYPEDECRSDNPVFSMNGTIRYDITGRKGGYVSLPVGNYRVITYNNDTGSCSGKHTDYYTLHHLQTHTAGITDFAGDTFVRSSGNVIPRPDGTCDEAVVAQPDEIWGCAALDVKVTESGVSYRCYPMSVNQDWNTMLPNITEHIITLFPHDLLCHWSWEVRNVEGLSNVTDACAAITGLSPCYNVSGNLPSGNPSTIPLAARKDGKSIIRGEFLTFGHPQENSVPHRFGLYVWTSDGQALFFGKDEKRFDVTHQIDTFPDQRHVHIVIDSLDLSNHSVSGGFSLDFDEWGEINETIPIM